MRLCRGGGQGACRRIRRNRGGRGRRRRGAGMTGDGPMRGGPLVVQIAPEKPAEGRPRSIEIYAAAIRSRLEARGVRFLEGAFDDARIAPGADLVWAPGLGNRRVPHALMAAGPRGVATIHGLQLLDSGPRIGKLGLRRGIGHWLWRRRIRADWARLGPRIGTAIAVSAVLAGTLPRLLRIPAGRITVIHHGIPRDFLRPRAAIAAAGPLSGGYLLHVSQHGAMKNLARSLAAYAMVRDRIGLPFRVVAAGWNGDPATLPPGVDLTTALVPHAAVRELMWGARAFVFPSLEEPFGLPVLEAMGAGVPVVTSAGTGAGEVAGEAALCVDPTDTGAIAAAMLAVATDPALHARLAAAGRDRAEAFSWDAAAARHLTVFEQVAGRRHAAA